METCKYCNPEIRSFRVVAAAIHIELELVNHEGEVAFVARGDNWCCYEPKFCPECGRRLKGEKIDI